MPKLIPSTKRGKLALAGAVVVILLAFGYGAKFLAKPRPAEDISIQMTGDAPKPSHLVSLGSLVGLDLPEALSRLKKNRDGVEVLSIPVGGDVGAGSLVVSAACANGSLSGADVRVYLGVARGPSTDEIRRSLRDTETFSRNGSALAKAKPGCDLDVAAISVLD